ncbi:MAG: exo-alpha-sialidase, partial [Flavisolibacter sp.]|nr:exo-alpha-sialidase [Flavisolibacter sp.]
NLTLRISYDDGKTWKKSFVVDADENKRNNAAYSDIVPLSKKQIGVLYEKDNYSKIIFIVVQWQ